MESKELDYETARRAVHGDVNAQRNARAIARPVTPWLLDLLK